VALLARHRARLLVLGVFGAYFALVAALGGYRHWGRIGVPGGRIWFGDLRDVTSAWDCARRGIAVLPVNPCDPSHDAANYPRLWLLPYHLGLGQGDTMALGFAVGALFLIAAAIVVPSGASLGLGAVYALFACSPAAMLGVERGNVDLILLALVVFAVLVIRREARGMIVSASAMLLAALLKLYPIFTTGFLVRRGRQASAAAAAVVALFVVYVAVLHRQMHEVLSAVPQSDSFSYGVRRASEWLGAAMRAGISARLSSYRAWDVVLVVVLVAAGVWLARRLGAGGDVDSARDLDLLWAGALTYVFTFALARNFDYRLVFLLPVVPLLYGRARRGSRFAILTLVTLFAVTWFDEWTHPPLVGRVLGWWDRITQVGPDSLALPIVVIAQFLLFGELVAWLVATAPSLRRRAGAAA